MLSTVRPPEHYALQLSDTLNFSRLIVDEDSISAPSFDVTELSLNTTYYWRVNGRNALGASNWSEVWNFSTLATGVKDGNEFPTKFSLSQNYPNPFNPSTTIRYGLAEKSHVRLEVFNILGQSVALLIDGEQAAGFHSAVFESSGLASGVYVYRLSANAFVQAKRLLLLR